MTTDEAKRFCKINNLKNLDIRGPNSIRASVRVNNKLHRIKIEDASCTKQGLIMASSKASELLNLAKYNFEAFLEIAQPARTITPNLVTVYIDRFLHTKKLNLAPSTFSNYRNKIIKHIVPMYGHLDVKAITPKMIEQWMSHELSYLNNKTIKELLTLLNQILTLALIDNAITENPFERLRSTKQLKLTVVSKGPDPFTLEEIQKISATETDRVSEKFMIRLNCYLGLRLSELMALSWGDIDLDKKTISIKRAVVNGKYKVPKTKSSVRTVALLEPAEKVLTEYIQQDRKELTRSIQVLNADNKTVENVEVSFVFYNTYTQAPYIHDSYFSDRFFRQLLLNAGVRYRGANQTRHTYASHLISAGIPLSWVALQMGHSSIKMLEKHYAKWLPTYMDNIITIANSSFRSSTA